MIARLSQIFGKRYVIPKPRIISPLIICQYLVGTSINSVDAFIRILKIIIEALSPLMMKIGLLERVPSELLARSIGSKAITQGARTDSIPASSETNSSAMTYLTPSSTKSIDFSLP